MAAKKKKKPEIKDVPWFAPSQIKQFVNEVRVEFQKIVWPNRKTTLGLTGIVIVLTVVISLYLGAVDMILGKAVSYFLG